MKEFTPAPTCPAAFNAHAHSPAALVPQQPTAALSTHYASGAVVRVVPCHHIPVSPPMNLLLSTAGGSQMNPCAAGRAGTDGAGRGQGCSCVGGSHCQQGSWGYIHAAWGAAVCQEMATIPDPILCAPGLTVQRMEQSSLLLLVAL
jgi:hypothetical protein